MLVFPDFHKVCVSISGDHVVPNMYHGEGGNLYLVRRRWDYFVKYLLGVTPPASFEIHEDREPAPVRPRQ